MSYPYEPDYVVAPGETLKEWFEHTHLPLSIARLYGLSEDDLYGVFTAEAKVTAELAGKLEGMTFVPASFWLALEHNFRVGLATGRHWLGSPVNKVG